ncbi:tryptophan synthase subunit alpha [Virgibacillus sp. W0430]|uniref:tryptophan synthase subunit alpha n=1 Tax=Virgibacillus sp. W0430 TaxID=3391580 RepID=UPI003F462AF7
MGKEKIEQKFQVKRDANENLFVPYIMAGDGGLDQLEDRMLFLQASGVAAIEVGIPFSDPVADGPSIQDAGQRALKAGTTLASVLETLEQFKEKREVPTIIMTYVNLIYRYGVEQFALDCINAGIDGVIVPDVPLEEEDFLTSTFQKHSIAFIRLAARTSPPERLKQIAERAEGFLYAVSVNGTTGARATHQESVHAYLETLKRYSNVPVLAGFGVSTPEQAQQLSANCDGVIVGSKIVDLFHQSDKLAIESLIKLSL